MIFFLAAWCFEAYWKGVILSPERETAIYGVRLSSENGVQSQDLRERLVWWGKGTMHCPRRRNGNCLWSCSSHRSLVPLFPLPSSSHDELQSSEVPLDTGRAQHPLSSPPDKTHLIDYTTPLLNLEPICRGQNTNESASSAAVWSHLHGRLMKFRCCHSHTMLSLSVTLGGLQL